LSDNNNNQHHYLGLVKDRPDHRDIKYQLKPKTVSILETKRRFPEFIDLRNKCPYVYNQGPLGSCTGHGIGGSIHIDRMKLQLPDMTPSALFIYYNERDMMGTVMEDSGASIRDGVKSINIYGVCSSEVWPYIIAKFAEKPPVSVYQEALKHPKIRYERVDNTRLDDIKGVLFEGYPIVFGCDVYTSFDTPETAKTGIIPFPNYSKFFNSPVAAEDYISGHCMIIVGYDDRIQCFIVRNSWGKEWGDNGYCYIPYDYLTNKYLAYDFWVIKIIKNQNNGPGIQLFSV
jgi:C1A family cysteine protease